MNIEPWSGWTVEVYGSNTKWLERLRRAGLIYSPSTKRWHRTNLTEQQAKSLAGRMREAGLKVLLHGSSMKASERRNRVSPPTPYDQVVLEKINREKAKRQADARRHLAKASAKKGRKARNRNDAARKSYERPPTSAP